MLPKGVVDHSYVGNEFNYMVTIARKAHESPGNDCYNIDFTPIKKYVIQYLDEKYVDEEKEIIINKWERLADSVYFTVKDAVHSLFTNNRALEVYKILEAKLEELPLFLGDNDQFVSSVVSWRIEIQK